MTLIAIDQLHHHPDNPAGRHADVAELADSIRAVGLLQPLLVEPDGDGYVVVAGNRRLAAARLLELPAIDCTVRAARADHVEVRLIENGHRRGLSPTEQAHAFGKLRGSGLSAAEIAKRTGFSLSHVSNRLALLELDDATRGRIDAGLIKPEDAVAAVRMARGRQKSREAAASANAPIGLMPEHFGRSHRLASNVSTRCIAAHGRLVAKGGLGGLACGRCWEAAIREDERARAAKVGAA